MFLESKKSKAQLKFFIIGLVLLCGALIVSYSLAKSGGSFSRADHPLYARVSLTGDSHDIG